VNKKNDEPGLGIYIKHLLRRTLVLLDCTAAKYIRVQKLNIVLNVQVSDTTGDA